MISFNFIILLFYIYNQILNSETKDEAYFKDKS